ncbi:sensor histidine kinase [Caloramator proteoclasticus]|uniref:histidine kinase n=1 Tax=Caloramator proteoclasticus DSM 10124 TaxID=1121262 RepID=A0A1M4UYF8_9CLOT|nr:HAMP domain-containing sensor histidine kinase [Caloramator proteoclasticus]SHE61791.1 HAMP domain-containing protein [Caloramator proteoclasticus DSM 10124]
MFVGRFVIEKYYINIKVDELKPELQNIIDEINSKGKSNVNLNRLPFIVKAYDIYKNEMNVFENPFKSIEEYGEDKEPYFEDNIKKSIEPFMNEVFSGEEIKKITNLEAIEGTSIVLGIPIKKDGQIIGGVFLLKPVSDYISALNGFNMVFLFMSILILVIILILLYFSIKPLIIPLKDMAYSAKKMAQGDYSVRIQEKGYGEVEELANSFNILAINLEEASKLAEGLEKTRREYVANISHELRTPIASLRAMSETLLDGMINDEQEKQRYYQIMLTESIRLQRLINDMLELSKLQSGNAYLEKSTVDISKLINLVYQKFAGIADDLGIELKLKNDIKNLPLTYTNAERIEQVLIILLDNAFKFTQEGGVVTISSNIDNEKVIISVEDTGEGIKKEDIPYIFERFYKVDKSRTTQGTGLGLAIAKQIIEALDEKIWVESTIGKGTKFSFTIGIKK